MMNAELLVGKYNMLQQLVDEYIAFLSRKGSEEKGSNYNTIVAYRNDLNQLCRYLLHQGVERWTEVTRDMVELCLLEMQQKRQYRPTTIVRKLASFKSFFRYLCKVGVLTIDPIEDLDAPTVHKNLPHVLEVEQIDNLLAQVETSTPVGMRDLAMMHILYATGMRVSELVALDVEDFDRGQSRIHVGRGSNRRRERWLPLTAEAVQQTQLYVREFRPLLLRNKNETALFVNHHGERLTRQGFWLIIKGYARQAGIKDITPHMIRHSFAALMLKKGMELRSVQELLGHAHLSTMYVYNQLLHIDSTHQ